MSSYNPTYTGGGFPIRSVCVLLLIVVVGLGICYISYGQSHGAEKHGAGAAAGRMLCDNDKFTADKVFYNENVGRCAYITEEDSGKVFVQIVEGDSEITMYVRNNMKSAIEAVKRYGYKSGQ